MAKAKSSGGSNKGSKVSLVVKQRVKPQLVQLTVQLNFPQWTNVSVQTIKLTEDKASNFW